VCKITRVQFTKTFKKKNSHINPPIPLFFEIFIEYWHFMIFYTMKIQRNIYLSTPPSCFYRMYPDTETKILYREKCSSKKKWKRNIYQEESMAQILSEKLASKIIWRIRIFFSYTKQIKANYKKKCDHRCEALQLLHQRCNSHNISKIRK